MKRTFIALLVALGPSLSAQAEDNFAPWQIDALAAIKAEPVVRDAIWSPISLWVSVNDDGTRRDGLAEYLCLTIRHQGEAPTGSIFTIRIWDHASMLRQESKLLARYMCRIS